MNKTKAVPALEFRVTNKPASHGCGASMLLGLCVSAVLALPANASLVSVTGGFTSYNGPVGTGQFETTINGTLVCPPTGCSSDTSADVGTTSLNFSTPVSSVNFSDSDSGTPETPNFVGFTPAAAQDVALGQEFLLGTFTYTNGDWFNNPAYGSTTFGFTLTSVSSDSAFNGYSFSDSLLLTITTNSTTNTPEQNADFISFVGRSDLGSVRVDELFDSQTGSNIGTANLYGKIDSLIPTRFGDPTGAAFIDPSVNLNPTSVPEPATAWLLLGGLGGLTIVGRRRTLPAMGI